MARQYNLKNLNGIHLKAPYDYASYTTGGVNALIEDYDFYPYKSNDLSDFEFINGSYNLVDKTSAYYNMPMGDGFIGNNSKASRTINVGYTQFKKNNTLVKGEVYYTSFDMYFNFNGEGENYTVNSTGYTINVNIYAIIGNNKKQLKLSNLKVYDYAGAYSGSTSNPYSNGYVDISTSFFSDYVSIVGGGTELFASYLPHPHQYVINNNGSSQIGYSWTEGTVGSPNYGNSLGANLAGHSSVTKISFSTPVVASGSYTIQDLGLAPEPNISPFNFMSGYMFKVTAELDVSTETLFNSNICTGNKDFKIMVDYNGRISQTTVAYVNETFDLPDSAPVGPPPSA
jgi:hypothetical protein